MNFLKFKILFFVMIAFFISSCGGKKSFDDSQKIWKSLTYQNNSCVDCAEFQVNQSTFSFRFRAQDVNTCSQLFDINVDKYIDIESDVEYMIKLPPVANCFNLQQNDYIIVQRSGSKVLVIFRKSGQLDIIVEYI